MTIKEIVKKLEIKTAVTTKGGSKELMLPNGRPSLEEIMFIKANRAEIISFIENENKVEITGEEKNYIKDMCPKCGTVCHGDCGSH